jgi:tol-pal system protein YbgF
VPLLDKKEPLRLLFAMAVRVMEEEPMKLTRWGAWALLLAGLAGCASRSDLEALQRDNEEMKGRVLTLSRELGTIRNESKEVAEKSTQGMLKDLESLRRSTADFQAALDAGRVDMQALAGRVDDLAVAGKKPADELSLLKEDSGRRLTTVEDRLGKLEQGLGELQKSLGELAKAKEAAAATPDSLYQQGQDLFKAGEQVKARERFTSFLEKYPTHQLAANARYWLGETYYSEKKFEPAILEYQQVIKDFPTSAKVPAAMLKQALAFKELGDTKSSRYILKKLLDDYPLADETTLAKKELKELK